MAHELSSKVIVPKRNVNMPTHCKLGIMPHAAHATYFLLHLMFTTLISIGLKEGPGWALIICYIDGGNIHINCTDTDRGCPFLRLEREKHFQLL